LWAWCTGFRFRLGGSLDGFYRSRFFDRALSPLDDSHASLCGGLFFGEILVSNLFCQLFRNRVGRDANVDTFSAHLFYQAFGVKL
jgi:hypothetical protein